MLSIFTWSADSDDPRKPVDRPTERSLERPPRFEAQFARSYAEMRARRQSV